MFLVSCILSNLGLHLEHEESYIVRALDPISPKIVVIFVRHDIRWVELILQTVSWGFWWMEITVRWWPESTCHHHPLSLPAQKRNFLSGSRLTYLGMLACQGNRTRETDLCVL